MKLRFRPPYFLHTSRCSEVFKLDFPDALHYGNSTAVMSRYGIVLICDMDWMTNKGAESFTAFTTSHNGYVYSAYLDQSRLSERKLKWYSTRFIRLVMTGEYKDYIAQFS